jgi:DNA-binding transcriptional regulator GbsR (MarR family)
MAGRDRDPEATRQFIDRFAGALVDAGVPQMPALVFVALLASDSDRLSADALASQLRVSRAAISGAVNYLIPLGLIAREREPGSRRHHYALQDPTWYELVARRERLLERWITDTRAGIEAVGPRTPAGRRLAESLAFFEFLAAEMPAMLARWREHQANGGKRGSRERR